MTKQEKLRHCVGCTENFYNGNNAIGVKECWMLKTAKLVTRYRIGTWTRPTQPGAFHKVKVFQCRHEKGYALCKTLPDFIDPKTLKVMEDRL
jgi:hypothetical protein